MAPAVAAILAQVGTQVAGGVANSIFNKPKPYDYLNPVQNQAQAQLAGMEANQGRRLDQFEGDLAAAGAQGFAGVNARESLMRVAAGEEQMMRGKILDAMAAAKQQQDIANTQMANQQAAARAAAIAQGASAVGQGLHDKINPEVAPGTKTGKVATAADGVPLMNTPEGVTAALALATQGVGDASGVPGMEELKYLPRYDGLDTRTDRDGLVGVGGADPAVVAPGAFATALAAAPVGAQLPRTPTPTVAPAQVQQMQQAAAQPMSTGMPYQAAAIPSTGPEFTPVPNLGTSPLSQASDIMRRASERTLQNMQSIPAVAPQVMDYQAPTFDNRSLFRHYNFGM